MTGHTRYSSGTEQPLAWHCCDERYPWIKDIVTTSLITLDAWRDSGIKFQPLYPRDAAQAAPDRDKIALDAAHKIEALPNDLRQITRTARIQVIVLEAMASSVSSTDRRTYCEYCDLEHRLHHDEVFGFHHVVKGETVPCALSPAERGTP